MRKGVLSRKQIWRKTHTKYLEKNNDFYDINNYDNEYQIFKDDKNVSFNSTVKVILIPEANEYKQIFLDKQLWYSKDDYFGFIKDATIEQLKSKYNSF